MRIDKLQPNELVGKKIAGFVYRVEKLSDGLFSIFKVLDGQIVSEYLVELQGFCTCPDFKQRRVKNHQACKHIQMVLIALAEDPNFKQGIVFFDENLKKLL